MELKVALIGYGKMGREIEKLLPDNCKINLIIDNPSDWQSKEGLLGQMDVAIEFSTPDSAWENCMRCFDANVPVITGTTGWNNQLETLLSIAHSKSASFIHGSNFSIGANLFFSVNQYLASLMNLQEQYNVSVSETHHLAKIDMPSGTAVTLTELILKEIDRKDGWLLSKEEDRKIPVYAHREEDITGIHEVRYTSNEDHIILQHKANNRQGFALGAIKAAQWLVNNPGIYDFKNIFHLI